MYRLSMNANLDREGLKNSRHMRLCHVLFRTTVETYASCASKHLRQPL